MKTSLGDEREFCEKRRRPLERAWMPEAACECVSATGMKSSGSFGSVVDSEGVSGTLRAKTLTWASLPAVR